MVLNPDKKLTQSANHSLNVIANVIYGKINNLTRALFPNKYIYLLMDSNDTTAKSFYGTTDKINNFVCRSIRCINNYFTCRKINVIVQQNTFYTFWNYNWFQCQRQHNNNPELQYIIYFDDCTDCSIFRRSYPFPLN